MIVLPHSFKKKVDGWNDNCSTHPTFSPVLSSWIYFRIFQHGVTRPMGVHFTTVEFVCVHGIDPETSSGWHVCLYCHVFSVWHVFSGWHPSSSAIPRGQNVIFYKASPTLGAPVGTNPTWNQHAAHRHIFEKMGGMTIVPPILLSLTWEHWYYSKAKCVSRQ